jgi:Tfp pilus assembly protein PilF
MQQTNRLTEACTLFQETLRLAPAHPRAPSLLATALHSQGRHAEALPHYESALLQTSGNVVLLQNFAALLQSLHCPQRAWEVISEAAALLPEDAAVREVQSAYKKLAQGVCRAEKSIGYSIG